MRLFAVDQEHTTDIDSKVESLLGKARPLFAWVDNRAENFRQWEVYPAYFVNGRLQSDVVLPLGRYGLYLGAGTLVAESEEGWKIAASDARLTFFSDKVSADISEVNIDSTGVCHFSFTASGFGEWNTGIRFVTDEWDSFLERRIWQSVFSEVFRIKGNIRLDAYYFPKKHTDCRLVIADDMEVESAFWTTELIPLELTLRNGFSFVGAVGADVTGYEDIYFTPSGAAEIGTSTMALLNAADNSGIMPGLSGTEYIKGCGKIIFVPGKAAFYGKESPFCSPDTAWVAFADASYYTQPQKLNFYEENGDICQWAALPGVAMKENPVPILLFGGIKTENALGTDSNIVVELEGQYLCAVRKKAVEEMLTEAEYANAQDLHYASTRNGMKAAFNEQRIFWLQLVPLKGVEPGLAFTKLSDKFWFSLLSSSLFIAIAKSNGRMEVPYSVDDGRLAVAQKYGYDDMEHLRNVEKGIYLSETELKTAVTKAGARWSDTLFVSFSNFRQEIGGWGFDFSPKRWEEYKTVAVIKGDVQNDMTTWMNRPRLWSLQLDKEEEASACAGFSKAVERMGEDTTAASIFLHDKGWRGCVFFDVGIDAKGFPEELSFLTTGMDLKFLRGSYVAYTVQGGASGESYPASALIAYNNDNEIRNKDYHEFDFRVRRLQVEIEEDKVKSFSAEAELLINALFGISTAGKDDQGGCSIVFDGGYQENATGGYYAFDMKEPVVYHLKNGGIESITISDATLKVEGIKASVVLNGLLCLNKVGGMDLFSYDELPFVGLTINMIMTKDRYIFDADYAGISFTPQKGKARAGSFAASFPVNLSGIVFSDRASASDMGFSTIKIDGYKDDMTLGKKWTGFVWKIETGDMGGMAAATRIVLELLTAYSDGVDELDDTSGSSKAACFYCGIRIAGIERNDSYALPLQGVLSLGFETIELLRNAESDINGYYFCFRNFSLTLLGKRFPETNNNLYLIGNEDGKLAWYGAVNG